MTDNEHKYPADEFDNPPSGPIGMHRGNRSLAVRIVPYLVTIVIAVLLGALAWAFFSGAFNSRTDASVAQSSSTAAESSSSASATDTASSSSSDASSTDASSTDASSADASSTESSTDATASSDSSSSAEESPSESSSSSAAANTAAQIVVYNGSGVTGAAASNAQTLENSGYTNVTATNPADYNSLPSATTVWYRTDADLATAQDVAAKLGVSQVVQAGNISSDVAVVLR